MPKREFICFDCDCNFTVTVPRGYDVQYCPACGGEISQDECNDLEDDEQL
jgi:Zn-finger nucleic acid-binding protein